VLELTYEEVAADLRAAMRRTLAHIHVSPPAGALDALPGMRRQADERSDAWAEAYARDSRLLSARGV
jgi:LPS sulfotransferase NodH